MDSPDPIMPWERAREYAGPVSEPPFYFSASSGLWIEIDRVRHTRCSPSRLYNLLTYIDPGPVLTKAGKPRVRQPPPHKDETQQFYIAQQIHYGLKPSSSREAAKTNLLRMLQFANTGINKEKEIPIPGNIREIERKLAAEYAKRNEAARKRYHEEQRRRAAAEEARCQKRERDIEELIEEFAEPDTAARQAKRQKVGISSKPVTLSDLAGVYTIAAPSISNNFNVYVPLILSLAPSATSSHLWGKFDFDVIEGTLRSTAHPSPGKPIKFHWRGRETGMGEATYGPENIAEFDFQGDGKFKGTMFWDSCCEKFDVYGKRDAEASRGFDGKKRVAEWKDEYWAINEANYDRECEARWSGWDQGEEDEDERREHSDTDAEGEDE